MNKNFTTDTAQTQDSLVHIMLELARAAIWERTPIIPDTVDINWDELMDMSKNQGLIAWVWDGICKLPKESQPPRQYRINWGMSAQEIVDRYDLQKKVLGEMIETCNQNDIRLLLLKGIGLSNIYSKPQLRPSGDIDIYLFEDYEKGNALFGDGINVFYSKHASFYYHGVHIENHLTPLDTDIKFRRKINNFILSRTDNISVTPEGFYVFSPLANLVYLVAHTLHHFQPRQAVSLRNIIDIAWFTRYYKEELYPEHCFRVLSELDIVGAFELFLIFGEIILDFEMPEYHFGIVKPEYISEIRSYILRPGYRFSIPGNLPKRKMVQLFYHYYRQTKRIYKYLPHKRDNLLRATIAPSVKRMLKIPENVYFSQGLKNILKSKLDNCKVE